MGVSVLPRPGSEMAARRLKAAIGDGGRLKWLICCGSYIEKIFSMHREMTGSWSSHGRFSPG